MRRRQFIKLLSGAAAARPLAVSAQQSSAKIPVVGVLWHAGSAEEEDVYLSVLVKAFNDLGYIDGKNIQLDQRFPAENPERFRKLGQELVDAHPAVLIAITSFGAVTPITAISTTGTTDIIGSTVEKKRASPLRGPLTFFCST